MKKNEGWRVLLDDSEPINPVSFPLAAYSEFMPPPRLGRTPLGESDGTLFSVQDPYGWYVSEIEEEYELRPGLDHVAQQVLEHLVKLGRAQPEYHLAGHKRLNLIGNPYWSDELAANLKHERYVVFLPLALSRSQDDMGRVRWTLFGGSEQGPERAFWKGFYSAPDEELPASEAHEFILTLLRKAYGETEDDPAQLGALGFRIFPSEPNTRFPYWNVSPLPSWTKPFLIDDTASLEGVRYLLTFRPFTRLPAPIKEKYLAGKLALLPFPGSLVSWGMPTYLRLQEQLPLALQIPLLKLVARHGGPEGIRVPQAGWLHEPHPSVAPEEVQNELVVGSYARTHRWQHAHRYEDELALNPRVDKITRVLFSTALDAIDLYDKPMARNSQIWTKDFRLLLDGPNATRAELRTAEAAVVEGGLFGYRFCFPPMRVGSYDVYWHRPLVAFLSARDEIQVLDNAPLGYLTGYQSSAPDLPQPIELFPRLRRRPLYLAALNGFDPMHDHYARETPRNVITLGDVWQLNGERGLPQDFARDLVRMSKEQTLDEWLASLAVRASDVKAARQVQAELATLIDKSATQPAFDALTFEQTATRAYEEAYWKDIAFLANGEYLNKDNADCVQDEPTQSHLLHHHRDLERLGDYLLRRHRQAIADAGMEEKAQCGELPFKWETDFDFDLFGGWVVNREGHGYERNLLVVIPGKNRGEAVVMADHYDTAYMEDVYDTAHGGSGARLAAHGADDNHSATTTLLRAAPLFLQLAKEGRLERDIWLLHLTGEEFPSDCLGARYFCRALVEKALKLHLDGDHWMDLSNVHVAGVFVMDMIAHNREDVQDIFQISAGGGQAALELAHQAHLANLVWNAKTAAWNLNPERSGQGRGKRSTDGKQMPETAKFLPLRGEIRMPEDPHSTLYNTDGQIFSDVGVPVVLLMENYSLNRTGYHDTRDTMENIDLDYGAALSAIAIETVARVANAERVSGNARAKD